MRGNDASGTTTDVTTIHDLGYRRYAGSRVGAAGAWRALYVQGLRTVFGLGRPLKAKILPAFVLLATLLPALALLAASSASQGALPIRYATILLPQMILFVLFTAAQAPELFSRDQQHRVLPLLLTREITRMSYATARLGALTTALFLLVLAPLLLLYIGEVGVASDPAAVFDKMGTRIGPVFAQAVITSLVLGCIGAALTIWTSRRAYATASVIGLFLTTTAISVGIDDLVGVSKRVAELVAPIRSLSMIAFLLFGETTRGMELDPPGSIWTYLGTLLAISAAAAAAFVARVRRMVP